MPPPASPVGRDRPSHPGIASVEFTSLAVRAVRKVAAEEILSRFRTVTAQRKDDGSLVTEADLAAQVALTDVLGRIEPVDVLGEEMAEAEQRRIWEGGGRFWCVDPLDGTANFSAGVPYFAVSVALMQGDRPLFGVVVDPIADEAYFAVRGAGAWRDGFALRRPAGEIGLESAIAEIDLRRSLAHVRHEIKHHPPFARRLSCGSSALSWCHLAAGRTDILLHAGQKVWDYAAGALIAEEAGMRIATLAEEDFWSGPAWERSVIAARTPELFAAWRDWVRARLAL
ncbi:MAG TPA: inositol monophosphatase family protein [Usitatibacteraceae bacterium]|nr:inositol monophosphatase family protein [Usitatibacteraceae bacterium]